MMNYEAFVEYEAFVQEVQQRTGLASKWETIDATRTVVETLLDCLPGVLAIEVALRLPGILRSGSGRAEQTSGERLAGSEFLLRIAQREDTDEPTAFSYAQAVLQGLAAPLGADLLGRVRAELPHDFDAFWETDPARAHMHQPVA